MVLESNINSNRLWIQLTNHLNKYSNFYIIFLYLIFNSIFHRILHGNEAAIFGDAKRFANPEFATGDYYLSQVIPYRILFNILAYPFVELFPDHIAVLIIRTMAYVLLAWGIHKLFRETSVSPMLTMIVFPLYYMKPSLFAGEWIFKIVEAKVFSYAFAILALGYHIQKRYVLAAFMMGVAASFHILVGGYAMLTYGMVRVLDYFGDSQQRERFRQDYLLPLLSYFPGAILGLYSVAMHFMKGEHADKDFGSYLIVMVRLAHHLAPFEVFLNPGTEIARDFATARRLADGQSVYVRNFFIALPFFVFGGILVYGVISRYANRATRFLARYALLSMIFFPIGAIFHVLGYYRLMVYFLYRYPDTMAVLMALIVLASIVTSVWNSSRPWYLRILRPVGIFFILFLILVSILNLYNTGYLRNLGRSYPHYSDVEPELMDAMVWIRDNTENKACVLINPAIEVFHHVAERCEFIIFKQAPLTLSGIQGWNERLVKINEGRPLAHAGFRNEKVLEEKFKSMKIETAKDISRSYNIRYMMTSLEWVDKNVQNKDSILYRNEKYVVLRIDGDL